MNFLAKNWLIQKITVISKKILQSMKYLAKTSASILLSSVVTVPPKNKVECSIMKIVIKTVVSLTPYRPVAIAVTT